MAVCQLADIALYYEVVGEGPPLLFIHGLGSSTHDWIYQVVLFGGYYRTITFDLRGHGQSSKPPGPYSIPQLAGDAAGLLHHLGQFPAHVVGLSLGGSIALQLALDYPELVRSLVVVNSGPALPLDSLPEKLHVLWNYLKRLVVIHGWGMRKMGEQLAANLLPGPEQAWQRQAMVERWAANDKRAYLAAMSAMRGWNVTARLPDITCPVQIIHAEYDYTPLSFKQRYAAHLPKAELAVIPDARHLTPVDKPAEFNRTLLSFLQAHPY